MLILHREYFDEMQSDSDPIILGVGARRDFAIKNLLGRNVLL